MPIGNLFNVLINILIANILAAGLIFLFMWFGWKNALDDKVFPTVSNKQRGVFGFIGFYLLFITGIEILNPNSFQDFVSSSSLTFKPGWLAITILDISVQDWIALITLFVMLLWLYLDSWKYARRVSGLNENTNKVMASSDDNAQQDLEEKLRVGTQGLNFAYMFSARSFLIGLIAPALVTSPSSNIGLIVILAIFLISGIYCFIEAMKLGAWFSKIEEQSIKLYFWTLRNVIVKGTLLYLLISGFGFLFYTLIPSVIDSSQVSGISEISSVVKVFTKVVAGVFVLLAAYLVAWGLSGLTERLNKLMITVSLIPLILPLLKILLSSGYNNDPSAAYIVILLISPVIAYRYGSGTTVVQKPRVAFVRNISWLPFELGGIKRKFDVVGYESDEALLEDVLGRTERTGKKTLLPSKIRQRIADFLGAHKEYDAIVVDSKSAIRIINAVYNQQHHTSPKYRYFIISGVCKRKNRLLSVRSANENRPVIWSGSPYLPPNPQFQQLLLNNFLMATGKESSANIFFVPPHCICDYFPDSAGMALLPEPFATSLKRNLQAKRTNYDDVVPVIGSGSDSKNFTEEMDVLLVKSLDAVDKIDALLGALLTGTKIINLQKTASGKIFSDTIMTDLDPIGQNCLDMNSISSSISNLVLDDVTIIDSHTSKGRANWSELIATLTYLKEYNVVNVTEEFLVKMCNCNVAMGLRNSEQ